MLNCLGLLEGLAQGSKPVQELARKQGALPLLVRCLGLALRLEGSRSQDGAQQAAELRRNGALAVTSLVAGNAAAIKQAKAAGAVEALLALLDRGADDEVLALNLTLTLTLNLALTLTEALALPLLLTRRPCSRRWASRRSDWPSCTSRSRRCARSAAWAPWARPSTPTGCRCSAWPSVPHPKPSHPKP